MRLEVMSEVEIDGVQRMNVIGLCGQGRQGF